MERRSLATVMSSRVCLLDSDTAVGGVCHEVSGIDRVTRTDITEVLGWDEGWPIVNMAPSVVSLRGVQANLFEGPADARYLTFASERVRWSQREPGSPDPGPFLDRFQTAIRKIGGVARGVMVPGAILLVVVLIAIQWRRRRVRRKPGI